MSVWAGFGVDDEVTAATVGLGPSAAGLSFGDPLREPIAASPRTIATPPASICRPLKRRPVRPGSTAAAGAATQPDTVGASSAAGISRAAGAATQPDTVGAWSAGGISSAS